MILRDTLRDEAPGDRTRQHARRGSSSTQITPLPIVLFTVLIVVYMLALEPLGFLVSSFAVPGRVDVRARRADGSCSRIVVSAVSLAGDLRDLPDGLLGRAAGRHAAGSLQVTEALSYFFMSWTDPYLLFLTAAGTFAGIYVGAIPGLSVTMAVSILISFTFKWHVNEALALIAGIYLGGVYGGSRSAILLNIPGAPAAIATGARRLSAGQARRGRNRDRTHDRRVGARRLHRHHRAGRRRAGRCPSCRCCSRRATTCCSRSGASCWSAACPASRSPRASSPARSACCSAWSASTR